MAEAADKPAPHTAVCKTKNIQTMKFVLWPICKLVETEWMNHPTAEQATSTRAIRSVTVPRKMPQQFSNHCAYAPIQGMGVKTDGVQAHTTKEENANNVEPEANNANQERPKRC